MTDNYTFPPLTSAYLCDPRVQGAVDGLARAKMISGFDPALDWAEFPAYVDAWLSAQQTVAEWCRSSFELWDLIWGTAVDQQSAYRPRLETFDDLPNGGISECWIDAWYGRHVLLGRRAVSLDLHYEDGFSLGVRFTTSLSKAAWRKLGLTDWQMEDDEIFGPTIPIDCTDGVATLDLISLQSAARRVVEALLSTR